MIPIKTMDCEFTAIIEKKGRTLPWLRRNSKEAIQLILQSNRSIALKGRSQEAKRELIAVRIAFEEEAARPGWVSSWTMAESCYAKAGATLFIGITARA
ncbi:MAG: hypothetical protein WB630_09200 [Candidatus Acidiferrales bacterium]